jgi:hypothetical protein
MAFSGNALLGAYGFTRERLVLCFRSAKGVFIEMEQIAHRSPWVGVLYFQEDLKERQKLPRGALCRGA